MTKAQTILAQERERLLTQERDKLREALSDLLDGEDWWEPRDPVRLERKK